MKKNFKKFASLMLALVMSFALAAPAFAADATDFTQPGSSITQVSTTQYTTFLDENHTEVTLYATTTSDYVHNQPFTSEIEAYNSVSWGWTESGSAFAGGTATEDSALSISIGAVSTADYQGPAEFAKPEYNGYYATATVRLNTSKMTPGVYSALVKMGAAYCNFTIAIQSAEVEGPIKGVEVKFALNGNVVEYLVDATAADDLPATSPLNAEGADTWALQKDPSAMSVLDGLMEQGAIDEYVVPSGYVNDIVIGDDHYAAAGMNGWQYGVYNEDGELMAISSVVSAAAFPLQAGEKVLWAYGAYGSDVIPQSWDDIVR